MSGISSSQSSSDYFGVSSGSSLLTDLHATNSGSFTSPRTTHLQAPTFASSLTGPERHYNLGLDLTSAFSVPRTTHLQAPTFGSSLTGPERHYNLGLDLTSAFSVTSANALNADLRNALEPSFGERFTRVEAPRLAALNLAVDLATESTPLKHLGLAIDLGKGINEINKAIEQSGKNGITPLEAGVCKTVNVAVDVGVTAIGTEALLFGVPSALALGVANPLLGATAIATAVVALPEAVDNITRLGTVTGDIAEEKCHKLFSEK